MTRHVSAETLSSYLDRQAAPGEIRKVEVHLEECVECRDRLEGLRRVVDGLRSLDSVEPPRTLGLELERHLARMPPPFAEREMVSGRVRGRTVLQPVVLAGLGVVLALAVITLLFLQALERNQEGIVPPPSLSQTATPSRVLVGDREFELREGGWFEATLSEAEVSGARRILRTELESGIGAEVETILKALTGPVTLRLDDEVVTLLD